MRTAPRRIRRSLALLLLALSAGWLLLRRRAGVAPPALVPVPDLPTPPIVEPPEPAALATDAGLTPEPVAAAPEAVDEPVTEVPADVLATDAGLTPAPAAVAPAEFVESTPTDVLPASPPAEPVPARALDPDATTVLPRFVDPDEPAPTGTDDLRRIRGIGPALERLLHELGLTTYRQVAELEGEPLARLRQRLEGFRDRIERQDWRGQARELHNAKYDDQI